MCGIACRVSLSVCDRQTEMVRKGKRDKAKRRSHTEEEHVTVQQTEGVKVTLNVKLS